MDTIAEKFIKKYTKHLQTFVDFKNIKIDEFKYRLNNMCKYFLLDHIMKGLIYDMTIAELNGLITLGRDTKTEEDLIVFETGTVVKPRYICYPLDDSKDDNLDKISFGDLIPDQIEEIDLDDLIEMKYIEKPDDYDIIEIRERMDKLWD